MAPTRTTSQRRVSIEPRSALASPAVLALLLLGLGLVLPAPLLGLLEAAARAVGGG